MPIDYKKIQATRRKTLYPLTNVELSLQRQQICWHLTVAGSSIREIGQIMKLTPDEARRYLAKAKKCFWFNAKGSR